MTGRGRNRARRESRRGATKSRNTATCSSGRGGGSRWTCPGSSRTGATPALAFRRCFWRGRPAGCRGGTSRRLEAWQRRRVRRRRGRRRKEFAAPGQGNLLPRPHPCRGLARRQASRQRRLGQGHGAPPHWGRHRPGRWRYGEARPRGAWSAALGRAGTGFWGRCGHAVDVGMPGAPGAASWSMLCTGARAALTRWPQRPRPPLGPARGLPITSPAGWGSTSAAGLQSSDRQLFGSSISGIEGLADAGPWLRSDPTGVGGAGRPGGAPGQQDSRLARRRRRVGLAEWTGPPPATAAPVVWPAPSARGECRRRRR